VDAPQVSASRVASAPAPRRAIASAAAAPWPLADRTDSEPIPNALAYAAQPTPIAVARTLPMGPGTTRAALAAPPETTIAVKRSDDRPRLRPPKVSVVRVGDRFNDPWMRAMIVSPSALNFMKTTVYGVPDFRTLGPYLQKPASTMMATFSEDPHRGNDQRKFAGSAVGFTAPSHSSAAHGIAAVVLLPITGGSLGRSAASRGTRLAANRVTAPARCLLAELLVQAYRAHAYRSRE